MGKKIVCIFDDEKVIRSLYKKKLELRGYEVCEAYDGETALQEVDRIKPDCILLDILMPGISGLEVLRQLKKNKKTKSIPVLILSNLSSEPDIKNALEDEADGYFVKMYYTPKEIVDKVDAQLNVKDK